MYANTPNTAVRHTAALPVSCVAAFLPLSNGQESPGLRVAAQLRDVIEDDMLEAAIESNLTWQGVGAGVVDAMEAHVPFPLLYSQSTL
jgi:hypothetical protein